VVVFFAELSSIRGDTPPPSTRAPEFALRLQRGAGVGGASVEAHVQWYQVARDSWKGQCCGIILSHPIKADRDSPEGVSMRRLPILCCLALAFITTIPATATTYVVTPDGTGDFPTIQAAIDAATYGDIVELTTGTFTGPGNRDIDYLGKALTIRSQSGEPSTCVMDCQHSGVGVRFVSGEGPSSVLSGVTITNGQGIFTGGVDIHGASPVIQTCILSNNFCTNGLGGGGLFCFDGTPTIDGCAFLDNISAFGGGGVCCKDGTDALIRDCLFLRNVSLPDDVGGAGGIYCQLSSPHIERCTFSMNRAGAGGGGVSGILSSPTIVQCTLYANEAYPGSGISFAQSSVPTLRNTVIAFGAGGEAVDCFLESSAALSCCDIIGNAGGDWVGCIEDQYGIDGNISADPLFCDPENGDYTLDACSPCLPGNHPHGVDCGLIGALGQGCGATAVEETSWGRIKALYRR